MLLSSNDKIRKKRQNFSPEFKYSVVKAVMYSSEKYSDIGKQLGVTTHQVARWHREFIEKDTGWVNQIKLAPAPVTSNPAEPMAVEIREIEFEPQTVAPDHESSVLKQAFFSVELCLPSGTKMSISKVTPYLLRTILEACR